MAVPGNVGGRRPDWPTLARALRPVTVGAEDPRQPYVTIVTKTPVFRAVWYPKFARKWPFWSPKTVTHPKFSPLRGHWYPFRDLFVTHLMSLSGGHSGLSSAPDRFVSADTLSLRHLEWKSRQAEGHPENGGRAIGIQQVMNQPMRSELRIRPSRFLVPGKTSHAEGGLSISLLSNQSRFLERTQISVGLVPISCDRPPNSPRVWAPFGHFFVTHIAIFSKIWSPNL